MTVKENGQEAPIASFDDYLAKAAKQTKITSRN